MWIAAVGECMVELRDWPQGGPGAMRRSFGGDTLNTTVYLARLLAARARVSYVTLLGDDAFGAEMLAAWTQEGIDTHLTTCWPDRTTGLYAIHTDSRGERSFTYWRSAAPARQLFGREDDPARLAALEVVDALYFSGITLAVLEPEGRQRLLELAARLKDAGRTVAFDDNYRPRLWTSQEAARETIRLALAASTLALVSADDQNALFGTQSGSAIRDRLRSWGCPEVVVKRGSEPCLLAWPAGEAEVGAERGVQVVDTTAAGDSFNAGYLAERLFGASPVAAARRAHHLAARVVSVPGALVPRDIDLSL